MKSKSVGILTKPRFPEIERTLRDVVGWLRARSIDVVLDTTSAMFLGEQGGIRKLSWRTKRMYFWSWAATEPCSMPRDLPGNEASPSSASTWVDSVFDRGPVGQPVPLARTGICE